MRSPELSIFHSRRPVDVRNFRRMSGIGVSTFSAMWYWFLSMPPLRLFTKSHLRIATFLYQSQLIIFQSCPNLYRFFAQFRWFQSIFSILMRLLIINTLTLTKCLYQVHFTPDQNRPESGFGFVMWLLWDRFILQIAPFLHRLKWLLDNVLQIYSFFCEFFDLFWKLQFWFQFVSGCEGGSRRRLLLQQWKQIIWPVFKWNLYGQCLSEISMCRKTSATT
jgi:hypothetical protein